MKHNPDIDNMYECTHCKDNMTITCKTCGGAGCMDCNYRGYRFCPYCTGKQHKPKTKRRIDIRR